MAKPLGIEVCLSPRLYPICYNPEAIVVVIDVLRATSAMCTAIDHGVAKIIPVETLDEAKAYHEKGYLVGAERDGEVVDGFNFGNSPFSYMNKKLKGETIVLTTTNGTRALKMAENSHQVVAGAFVNLTILCDWLAQQNRDVILLCAGWKDRYNLEDSLYAGAVTQELQARNSRYTNITDSSLSSMYLYEMAKDDPDKFLRNSSHRTRLAHLNLKEDIRYCLQYDTAPSIPVLVNGALLSLSTTLAKV